MNKQKQETSGIAPEYKSLITSVVDALRSKPMTDAEFEEDQRIVNNDHRVEDVAAWNKARRAGQNCSS
jgi:hypothetical protein